ncbi:MAG: MFS transporter, partial [Bacilli bacterium]
MWGFTKAERGWMIYDWASSAYTLLIMTALLPLYWSSVVATNELDGSVATSYWGFANGAGSLVVALFAPIISTYAGYAGHKMPMFRFFTLIGILCTALLATIPTSMWIVLLFVYVLSDIAYSGSVTIYDSFLVDTSSKKNMDKVSSVAFGIGYFGSVIPFVMALVLIIGAQKGFLPLSTDGA